jgi:hypothetical protein
MIHITSIQKYMYMCVQSQIINSYVPGQHSACIGNYKTQNEITPFAVPKFEFCPNLMFNLNDS